MVSSLFGLKKKTKENNCASGSCYSAVPETIPTPWKVIGNPYGEGVLKCKILDAKYVAKLEFPGGPGVQNKKPSVGGVWIFSGIVH